MNTKPCSLCGSRWAHAHKCPRAPKPVPCKECGVPKFIRARGLCRTCYYVVREREDSVTPRAVEPEPTDEELDAIIAERMKDLPEWWEKEAFGQRSERAAAVVRGRGLWVMIKG